MQDSVEDALGACSTDETYVTPVVEEKVLDMGKCAKRLTYIWIDGK